MTFVFDVLLRFYVFAAYDIVHSFANCAEDNSPPPRPTEKYKIPVRIFSLIILILFRNPDF